MESVDLPPVFHGKWKCFQDNRERNKRAKHTDDIAKKGSTEPPAGNNGLEYEEDKGQTPREMIMAEILAKGQQ